METLNRRAFIGYAAPGVAAVTSAAAQASAAAGEGSHYSSPETSIQIGEFAAKLGYDGLSNEVAIQTKEKLLDALACGIGALGEDEVGIVHRSVVIRPDGPCTLFGGGRASAPDAALLNTSLTRYLDYMDSYLGPHGGGHPGDCVGAILACGELSNSSAKNLLAAIAVSYEVLGAFADVTRTREHGWDHLAYVGIAMAAGAAKALQLPAEKIQQAVGIMAASVNPLRVTRAEQLTMWKGFAAAFTARNAVYAALLAKNGMIGPKNPFNGTKGWKDVVAQQDFELAFTPGERMLEVWTKLYLAETYVLPATEGAIELATENHIPAEKIRRVKVRTFHDAVLNAGPAEGRDPYDVSTKAQADHSLPYMVAVALIDKNLSKAQYTQERIHSADVQTLLRKVEVEEDPEFTKKFKKGLSPVTTAIEIEMTDGQRFSIVKEYFSGHPKKRATEAQMREKFLYLCEDQLTKDKAKKLATLVENFEKKKVSDLTALLS